MKTEENIDFLKPLEHINKVDAPEFLFTRIQQRIANVYTSTFTPRAAWSMGIAFVLILSVNIGIVLKNTKQKNTETTIAETMNLVPTNNLYR